MNIIFDSTHDFLYTGLGIVIGMFIHTVYIYIEKRLETKT